MFRKIVAIAFSLALCINFAVPAFAAEVNVSPTGNQPVEFDALEVDEIHFSESVDDEVSTNSDAAYRFRHEYTIVSTSFGGWRPGVRGGTDIGPSELTLNQSVAVSNGLDLSFTTTVTGEYINGSSIETALGVTFNKSKTYAIETSFTVPVKQYQRILIQYRPMYYTYKVVETYYKQEYVLGFGFVETDLFTHTCYVTKFACWDYTAVDVTGITL